MRMNYELRDMIDRVYELCDTLNPQVEIDFEDSLQELLETELLMFLMYLSASDGEITWQEAEFIRDQLGQDMSASEIEKFVNKSGVYSQSFTQKVPLCVELLAELDRKDGTDYASLLADVYETLGQAFLACDDEVDHREQADLDALMATIKAAIQA